ncbi:MAG: hypothetical protein AAF716_14810 [Cyanobacteria bacterium P01_D01_bin.1]
MKTLLFPTVQPARSVSIRGMTEQPAPDLSPLTPLPSHPGRAYIRHILLGNPEAVQQTIHLLHTLRYTETVLWSRAIAIQDPLVIPPAPGEVISLLRKQV